MISICKEYRYKSVIHHSINSRHTADCLFCMCINNRLSITKLILDYSNITEELGNQQNIDEIETLCRNYCYKLHNKRREVVKMVADT